MAQGETNQRIFATAISSQVQNRQVTTLTRTLPKATRKRPV
jgi:hypothetical protein